MTSHLTISVYWMKIKYYIKAKNQAANLKKVSRLGAGGCKIAPKRDRVREPPAGLC